MLPIIASSLSKRPSKRPIFDDTCAKVSVRRSGPGAPAGEPLRADDESAIARFCEALLLEDGLSANTLAAYQRDLEGLSRWLADGGAGPLALAGTGELQAYIAFRFPASKASSGNRRLTVFRRLTRSVT